MIRNSAKIDESRFFSTGLFQKIKDYLHSAGKDDPPVIGTTEDFCKADPKRKVTKIGMSVKTGTAIKMTKDLSIEEALSETHAPGAADLVNKLIEDESHDD